MFIDWRLSPQASLNLGQFLLPVGLLNESHEPDVFYGVERNPVEERIIPATWWEKGAMLRLLPKNGIALDLAVHNGLRGDVATLGGAEGLREFRQEFGGARAENMAYTLRLKVQPAQGLELGVTAQWQEDINDASIVPERAPAVLLEAHADCHWRDMRFRSLYAQWSVDGAMAKAAGADLISGYYVEPSWKASDRVGLFARFSQWNTAATLAGKEDDRQVNIGFNYGLNPRVVLKADLQDSNQPGGLGDGLNLGVGMSF